MERVLKLRIDARKQPLRPGLAMDVGNARRASKSQEILGSAIVISMTGIPGARKYGGSRGIPVPRALLAYFGANDLRVRPEDRIACPRFVTRRSLRCWSVKAQHYMLFTFVQGAPQPGSRLGTPFRLLHAVGNASPILEQAYASYALGVGFHSYSGS